MDWKEKFSKKFVYFDQDSDHYELKPIAPFEIKDFISTEIIEKLIEDAVFLTYKEHEWKEKLKQQLRDKWL